MCPRPRPRAAAAAMLRARHAAALLRARGYAAAAPAPPAAGVAAGAAPSRRRGLTPPRGARAALLLGTSTALLSGGLSAAARPLHADSAVTAAATAAVGGGSPADDQAAKDVAFSPVFVAPVRRMKREEMEVTLFQYEVCPFCNKVRAFLDYYGVPYRVVEVDPMGKKELERFSADYRKVPIAVVNGMQVNGSGAIIDAVTVSMDALAEKPAAHVARDREWTEWVDDHLIHLISPNIYGTMTESFQAFEYIVDNAKFSAWQRMSIRYSGTVAMYMVGKKIKKKYNIERPREEMYEAIDKWTAAVDAQGGRFLGGDAPSTADLAVFGVLRAISKFDTFADIKKNCASFEAWFDRTREAVGEDAIVEHL